MHHRHEMLTEVNRQQQEHRGMQGNLARGIILIICRESTQRIVRRKVKMRVLDTLLVPRVKDSPMEGCSMSSRIC